MGWLITMVVIGLLLIIPIGVSAWYDNSGAFAQLILGLFRLTVFPRRKKPKDNALKEEENEMDSENSDSKKKKTGGSIWDFKSLLDLILDLLTDLRRKLRVERLELKLILAGEDPCDLALNYGRVWTALGNLMPTVERYFVIKRRDLEVECDFTSSSTLIFARIDLTITLGRVLSLGVWHGFRLLREYLRIMNQRKGGAKT